MKTAEWIIAASVQDHDFQAGAAVLHLIQRSVGRYHLERSIGGFVWVGGNRHQIVDAVNLHPMTCVVEKSDGRTLKLRRLYLIAEFLQSTLEGRLVEIKEGSTVNQSETFTLQVRRHQLCIVGWIGKCGHVLVVTIADYQSHFLAVRCEIYNGERWACRRGLS